MDNVPTSPPISVPSASNTKHLATLSEDISMNQNTSQIYSSDPSQGYDAPNSSSSFSSTPAPPPAARKSSSSRRRTSSMFSNSSISSVTSNTPGMNNIPIADYSKHNQSGSVHSTNGFLSFPSGINMTSPNTNSIINNNNYNPNNPNGLHNSSSSHSPPQPSYSQGYYPNYNSSSSSSNTFLSEYEKLRQDLELEQMETQNLDRQLRETRKKLENSLHLQSQLENDVVDMAKEVTILQNQIKDFKKINHNLENELSQEQVTYMNEKQQWLDKEQQFEKSNTRLRDENSKLKSFLEEQAQHEANLLSNMTPHTPNLPTGSINLGDKALPTSAPGGNANALKSHSKYFSIHSIASFTGMMGGGSTSAPSSVVPSPTMGSFSSSSSSSSASSSSSSPSSILSASSASTVSSAASNTSATLAVKDKIIDRLKNELEQLRQQTELVSREYTIRHNQIEGELQHQKTLVGRLMEENEGFQYLLAEKAILGGFASDAEDKDSDDNEYITQNDGDDKSINNRNSIVEVDEEDEDEEKKTSETSPNKPYSSRSHRTHRNTITSAKEIHTSNSLADELERMSMESQEDSSSDDDGDEEKNGGGSQTHSMDRKKRVYNLEFEVRSLRNHNKALSLSLERLVQRLLEFKQFEQEVETSTMSGSINAQAISQFQTRVASNNGKSPQTLHFPTGNHPLSHIASNNGSNPHLYSISSNNSYHGSINNNNGSSGGSGMGKLQGNGGAGGLDIPKRSRHGHKDSVSSTTSSLYQFNLPSSSTNVGPRGGRHFKSPAFWNNMLMANSGGSGGGGSHHGRRSSFSSSINTTSPTSSVIHLGIDGESSLSGGSGSGSGSTSSSGSESVASGGGVGGSYGLQLLPTGASGNNRTNFAPVTGGLSLPSSPYVKSALPESPTLSHHSLLSSAASITSVNSDDQIDIVHVRRPSTNSQRSLRPFTIASTGH